MNLDSKMTVEELMRRHPSAMDVFINKKMLCIGCPFEGWHTLQNVAQIYGYSQEGFLKILYDAIQDKEKP